MLLFWIVDPSLFLLHTLVFIRCLSVEHTLWVDGLMDGWIDGGEI